MVVDEKNQHFISLELAKEIASETVSRAFANNNSPLPSSRTNSFGTISQIFEIHDENEVPALYIINFSDSGYVILAADNRTSPIKSFSLDHNFSLDEEEYPFGLVEWLMGTTERISEIRQLDFEQSNAVASTWDLDEMEALMTLSEEGEGDKTYSFEQRGPLLSTTWGQRGGYNNQAPIVACKGGVSRALTGCVATALAQVINYHQYPNWYNWNNMPDLSGSTEISRLMKNVGDAVDMDWGCDVSSADTKKEGASSLKDDFHYSSAKYADYNYSNVENEIKQSRPVILRGGKKGRACFAGIFCYNIYENGHAWVCDGYKKNTVTSPTYRYSYKYLHMNWGWDGELNDWYSYSDWSPSSSRSYNYKRCMIYNIKP